MNRRNELLGCRLPCPHERLDKSLAFRGDLFGGLGVSTTKRICLLRFWWLLVGRNPAFNLVEEIEKHGCMVGRLLQTGGIRRHQRGEAFAIRIEIQRRDDARVGKSGFRPRDRW